VHEDDVTQRARTARGGKQRRARGRPPSRSGTPCAADLLHPQPAAGLLSP
jgi:hypothetical protein